MCKKVAIKQGGTLSNFRFGEAHPVALSPRKTAPPEPWYTSLEEGRTVFVCEMSNVKREKSSVVQAKNGTTSFVFGFSTYTVPLWSNGRKDPALSPSLRLIFSIASDAGR